jgi:dihydroxyacid dehydratase/phosphogluconate dehydratase
VIAGKGHVQHFCGVPERVFKEHPSLEEDALLVVSHPCSANLDLKKSDEQILEGVTETFGKEGSNPADYIYIYDESEYEDDNEVKRKTAEAYNQVGETAHLHGNLHKARAIMKYLGYRDNEIEIAGNDAYNY